jgi:hypothetical protein
MPSLQRVPAAALVILSVAPTGAVARGPRSSATPEEPASIVFGTAGAVTTFCERFSNNAAGWTLGTEWAIGPTAVSPTPQQGFPDPAFDFSATADNGVAGTVLGGNPSINPHSAYYLTSPALDVSGLTAVELRFERWLNTDEHDFNGDQIEVWDGVAWSVVWATPGNALTTDSSWIAQTFDVTSYINPALKVRFAHAAIQNGSFLPWVMSGWNIDNLCIGVPALLIDDFESADLGAWTRAQP